MKRPTAASLKRVNAANLASLGAERLAEILVSAATGRPELKRRLRMELAAEQGGDHLAVEIDKRLAALQTSRSKVSWRQRASFLRDLDTLRALISDRLAPLDAPGALDRLWSFMALARQLSLRVRDRDGELEAVFAAAARNLGAMLRDAEPEGQARRLVQAVADGPSPWAQWAPLLLDGAPATFAHAALKAISGHAGATPAWMAVIRPLADAAGNPGAYRSTYTPQALTTPAVAAQVARRMLAAERVEEAGAVLRNAVPTRGGVFGLRAFQEPDFDWETVWIDYLEQAGEGLAAQQARWASFERTLAVSRARAFTKRLKDFEDVEAENRAFAYAAAHADFARALRFLVEWPALPEAARLIQARPDDVDLDLDDTEAWAARLRLRYPAAAHVLLRKAAAAAFRRRDLATCERLTQEAETLAPG